MLSRPSLENMYLNLFRPLLEYGDLVWDRCTAELKNDIESVQNEAARIVSGATKRCNIHTLLAELRWDTFACRQTLLYKMKHGLTPNYLTHMIPNQSQDRYPLRNAERILLHKVKIQQCASSFLPSTIREYVASNLNNIMYVPCTMLPLTSCHNCMFSQKGKCVMINTFADLLIRHRNT